LGTDEEKLSKAKKLVYKELDKLRNQSISTSQLQKAKDKFKGQIALAEESRMNVIIAETKNIIDYGRIVTLDEVFTKIDQVSAVLVQDLSNEFFDTQKLISLSFIPEE
jgi:predicted Zn-dependent peptidase